MHCYHTTITKPKTLLVSPDLLPLSADTFWEKSCHQSGLQSAAFLIRLEEQPGPFSDSIMTFEIEHSS